MDWEIVEDTEKALERANYKLEEAWEMLKQSIERAAEIAIERDSLKFREKVLERLLEEEKEKAEKYKAEFRLSKKKLEKYEKPLSL